MFKRAKIIGLFGFALISMLGTQAEAHYLYANGTWYYHSVGCAANIDAVLNPTTNPAAVECLVNTSVVETLCPDSNIISSPIQASLVAQTPITSSDVSGSQAHVEVVVPDTPLLNVNLNLSCGNSNPVSALIRTMTSTVTVFRCVGLGADPCSVRLVTSTATATCTMDAKYNPGNLPPPGTAYTCTNPLIAHVL